MSCIPGIVIGTVASIDAEGRVEVDLPWLEGGPRTFWAPVATMMAGDRRGTWFMPEQGDEVVVAFDHGDPDFPYVIGFLWNGQHKPPNEDIDEHVRRIKTVAGHTIDFDDRAGQERILVKSKGEHELELKDGPPGTVTLKSKGGHMVKIEEVPGQVTVKTKAGQEVKLSDAPPGVTITTLGTLSVSCLSATVTATGSLMFNAPITTFAGVVQVPMLIANAISSTAYTPAPGDTIGA